MIDMSDQSKKIVTRFAPSPTGLVHTGNIHTGLFAWLWAKKNNGTFILRIEDTDKKREVEGAIDYLKESLTWLGIMWDEGPDIGGPHGPYIQSERIEKLHIYETYARRLLDAGFAYPDEISEEQIDVLRKKAEEEKRAFLYREHRPENTVTDWKPGTPLRFKIKELKRTVWNDAVRGELSAGPEALDDFILIKSDGYPTYNFAHLVDDIEMGITHVTRGQEFISSTPNYIAVYEALGATQPMYVTVPHVMGEGGKKKLGKRDGAKDVLQYRTEGYLPEALVNFLALMGWNPGTEQEIFTVDELITAFDIAKIQKSGAQFNEEKLDWLNKEHMKLMPEAERNAEIQTWFAKNPALSTLPNASAKLADTTFMSKLYPIIFDRISKWSDINTLVTTGELSYFFEAPQYNTTLLSWKGQPTEEIKKHLTWVRNTIANAPDESFITVDGVKSLIFDYATEQGRGQVLWPTRVALSGRDKSPDPFTLIYILGKEESLRRLDNAITTCGK